MAVVGFLAMIALQGLVIAALLVERRRRRAAEAESSVRLLELVHLNQSATAGALSASIGHELNQPLSAIRSNAEAAGLILQSETPDLKLVQQILADIRDDDTRACEIISRLRGLLRKRSEVPRREFDLNDVVRSAGHILHAEAERRGVDLVFRQASRELRVLGRPGAPAASHPQSRQQRHGRHARSGLGREKAGVRDGTDQGMQGRGGRCR